MSGKTVPWAKVRTRYVMDELVTYADLASEFGIALGTVASRARREKWSDERRKHLDDAIETAKARAQRAYAEQAIRFAGQYLSSLLEAATAIQRRQLAEATDSAVVERTKLDSRIVVPILQAADRIASSLMPTLIAAAASGARMTFDASATSNASSDPKKEVDELPLSADELRALTVAALAGNRSGSLPEDEDDPEPRTVS